MGNPKGNPGNKGGGRKSAYQEKADADFLSKFFFQKYDKSEIQKMIQSGKYSVSDVMLTKAFAGDMKAIATVFNKLFPDNLYIQGEGIIKIDGSLKKTIDSIYGSGSDKKISDKG